MDLVCVWIHVCGECLRIIFFFFLGKACFCGYFQFSMGPIYYSQNSQTSLFIHFFIKKGFHNTIHIFKNYFVTIFSVFSKISYIQIDPLLIDWLMIWREAINLIRIILFFFFFERKVRKNNTNLGQSLTSLFYSSFFIISPFLKRAVYNMI